MTLNVVPEAKRLEFMSKLVIGLFVSIVKRKSKCHDFHQLQKRQDNNIFLLTFEDNYVSVFQQMLRY